ncbi:aminotransferase class I/II-fold pyridoxal phosphate-dependent enzyme [bacterium]|nr:aminotransferase class I/II-fold pyridoxal phosphate-dependent enzyme [bacterium]
MIDLRSDTLTRPCSDMRQAMMDAEVNDDVIDVDPTVARLQSKIAELLGKEAAMFMPSGTMTNQVAVRLHCRPGDEFLCEAGCHIYNYEQGAFAQLSGVAARTFQGTNSSIDLSQLLNQVHPDNEHATQTRLLCLENTHNKGGGVVLPYDSVAETCQWARESGLNTHLDGARLFNAVVASKISANQWAQHFDTISICFSKGLGAPVGSALVGDESMIYQMRRHRKLFGGGMRQSGFLAAAALFSLENNIPRLAEDHQNAQKIAQIVSQTDGLQLDVAKVETNIIVFGVSPEIGTASFLGVFLLDCMRKDGVKADL